MTKYEIKDKKILKNLTKYILDLPIETAVNLLFRIRNHENILISSGIGNYLGDNKDIMKNLVNQSEKAKKLMKVKKNDK